MSLASSRLRALAVTTVTALAASLLLLPTTNTAQAAAPAPAAAAPAGPLGIVSKDTVGGLMTPAWPDPAGSSTTSRSR